MATSNTRIKESTIPGPRATSSFCLEYTKNKKRTKWLDENLKHSPTIDVAILKNRYWQSKFCNDLKYCNGLNAKTQFLVTIIATLEVADHEKSRQKHFFKNYKCEKIEFYLDSKIPLSTRMSSCELVFSITNLINSKFPSLGLDSRFLESEKNSKASNKMTPRSKHSQKCTIVLLSPKSGRKVTKSWSPHTNRSNSKSCRISCASFAKHPLYSSSRTSK